MGSTLDAATLLRAMSLYLEALEAHREEIDSLNVFPVPDGDTGTNMVLTQRAVVEACRDLDGAPIGTAGETIAHAALMGARGNSGVILSQILRGLCEGLGANGEAGPADLAAGLARADREARRAVAEPLEGTILSVLHDAAAAARESADRGLGALADAAFRAAEESLERTPDQLEELRDAGVVDAGGKGLVLLLDAVRAAIVGGDLATEAGPLGPVGRRPEAGAVGSRYGSEVMFLVDCSEEEAGRLRSMLSRIGESVVVVGGGGTFSAHVHTDDPDAAVAAGKGIGEPARIRVASLDEQVAEHCIAADGLREVRPSDAGRPREDAGHSLVAVAEGPGMVRLFESLGASVVRGGPGNNPSVRDLAEAIERAPGKIVFVLPNHRNIVPAAEAAARQVAKEVRVSGTGSMAHGLAVAAAYVPGDPDPEAVGAATRAAEEEACWGEVAIAEKPATWQRGGIEPGDWLGLRGETILAVGDDPSAVAVALGRELGLPEGAPGAGERSRCGELITLYVGADAADEDGERVAGALAEAFPHHEIDVQRGDQPRYPYLIGVE